MCFTHLRTNTVRSVIEIINQTSFCFNSWYQLNIKEKTIINYVLKSLRYFRLELEPISLEHVCKYRSTSERASFLMF